MSNRSARPPAPATPKSDRTFIFIDTAEDHSHTARLQIASAVTVLVSLECVDAAPTSSTVAALARLLEAASRHLALAEEWVE